MYLMLHDPIGFTPVAICLVKGQTRQTKFSCVRQLKAYVASAFVIAALVQRHLLSKVKLLRKEA